MILKFGLKVIPYTYTLLILNKFHSKMALLCEGTKKNQQKGFSTYAELAFFFPHVSRAQRLAPARTRTRVVRLGAQCSDHWTTGQSRGVGVPAVQLTTHVKSSTLYGFSA